MSADGISYLDIADAYIQGDWKNAINATWSPLYSWLIGIGLLILKPSQYTEFVAVHIVNYIIYIFALGCFHFFIKQFINFQRYLNRNNAENLSTFSESALIAIGYALFIQASLNMIGMWEESPDMLVLAFVLLIIGIILRTRMGSTNYLIYVLLGLTLGIGYLAKAVMFPLTFIFLLISLIVLGNLNKAVPRIIMSLIVFLLISGPFIIAISNAKGRLTFGDAGKYNYWLAVNNYNLNINRHWDVSIHHNSGTPKHAVRKIFDNPRVYEFGTPIKGTYPVWYDPSYWYDGLKVKFDLKKQIIAIKQSLSNYYHLFYPSQSILIFSILTLYLMTHRKLNIIKHISQNWILMFPAITGLSMYTIIYVLPRYVAPFIVLFWLGILSSIHLHYSEESKRLLKNIAILIVSVTVIITATHLLKRKDSPPSLTQIQVASELNKMGISPGDKVASIGYSFPHFWARLARVKIVAEMPSEDAKLFWKSDSNVQSKVIDAFRSTGAKVIVTGLMPREIPQPGWEKIADTDYYIFDLKHRKSVSP